MHRVFAPNTTSWFQAATPWWTYIKNRKIIKRCDLHLRTKNTKCQPVLYRFLLPCSTILLSQSSINRPVGSRTRHRFQRHEIVIWVRMSGNSSTTTGAEFPIRSNIFTTTASVTLLNWTGWLLLVLVSTWGLSSVQGCQDWVELCRFKFV